MTAYVVDTNVAIVANGRNTYADTKCKDECIRMLKDVCSGSVIVVDDRYFIFSEYKSRLSFSGAPGMGDAFFKHVFNHMHGGSRVRKVSITPCDDERRGFDELPQNKLDPSDRKFLATALVAEAEILNATDSDWSEQAALTSSLGVTVRQLCPQHAQRSADRR